MDTQNPETGNVAHTTPQERMSTQKKALIIGAILLVGLYIIQTFVFSPERIAERMIESTTDGAYDVSFNTKGNYTVTGEDGSKVTINQDTGTYEPTGSDGSQVTMASGGAAKLPDNWPDSVPLPDGVTIDYAMTAPGDDNTTIATIHYTTDESIESISTLYKKGLSTNGWTHEALLNTPTGFMLTATRDNKDHTVTVYVGDVDGRTDVTVTTQ